MKWLELFNEPEASQAIAATEVVRAKLETAMADLQLGKFDLAVQRFKEAAEAAQPLTSWLAKLGD